MLSAIAASIITAGADLAPPPPVHSPVTPPRVRGYEVWTCRNEVYELMYASGALYARTSGGIVAIKNGRLSSADEMPRPPIADRLSPIAAKGDGVFLSAFTAFKDGYLASYWGGSDIFYVGDGSLTPYCERPPATGDYALLTVDDELYAGTDKGLFVRERGEWKRLNIGGELPSRASMA